MKKVFNRWVFGAFALVAVGIGLFYWYEWRPAEIKKGCAWVRAKNDEVSPEYWRTARDSEYKSCLREHGL